MQWLLHELPITRTRLLVAIAVVSAATGILADSIYDTRFDVLFHDAATVFHDREEWRNTSLIVLDDQVPEYISRRQLLPLYALAAERVLEAGAEAVFLDATLTELAGNIPYAECLEGEIRNTNVRWSAPESGFAPLQAISAGHIDRFLLPVPSAGVELSLLFNLDTYLALSEVGEDVLFADTTQYFRRDVVASGTARWVTLTQSGVAYKLASRVGDISQTSASDEQCAGGAGDLNECRRIRLSQPQTTLDRTDHFPIQPLSQWARCEVQVADDLAGEVAGRIVILQMTSMDESTDLHITPMTTSLLSPKLLTSGPHYIADSIETLVSDDHPRRPYLWKRILLIMAVAFSLVWITAYIRSAYALLATALVIPLGVLICFVNPAVPLWPVTASSLTAASAFVMTVFSHVALGTRHSRYTAQYLPKHIRRLLLSLDKNERFQNQRWQAVILMSDLVGYTTVTSLLKDPALIFNLLNKYLESTTVMLQDKYDGWLEAYVGDLFCYYWPQMEGLPIREQMEKSLHAAIELKNLQKEFFRKLPNLDLQIPDESSEKISRIVNAGIGICSGEVVAGNVGPKGGVQKFGLLGDPLNLSSRLEALTRLFDTEIIISGELAPIAQELGYQVREIASVKVKGRLDVVTIYAMGESGDNRFSKELLGQWEEFRNRLQQTGEILPWDDESLQKDHETLLRWYKQGLYEADISAWKLVDK